MNINFIIINNAETISKFDPQEIKQRTDWMTNCYNEIWYAYVTDKMPGDVFEKISLRWENIAANFLHEKMNTKFIVETRNWWEGIAQNPFLQFLEFKPSMKMWRPHVFDRWATWSAALNTVLIDDIESRSLVVIADDFTKIPADLMERAFAMLHEDENNEKTTGGGIHEINPINSSKTIWVNSDNTVLIGHYHALVQMLKLDSYKQMISNMHLIKSTIWGLDNVSLLGIMGKHLGLRIREITN